MIEVIASLYDSVTNKLVAAKKVCFPDNNDGRLTLMWSTRDKEGLSYSETVCRDLPLVSKTPAPEEGVKTAVDWIP